MNLTCKVRAGDGFVFEPPIVRLHTLLNWNKGFIVFQVKGLMHSAGEVK